MALTTITRATWTDDDGSGTTGTILNNARLQGDVYDKVDGLFSAAAGLKTAGPLVERNRAVAVGDWIPIAYNAGNFTAAPMTWTVEAADQSTLQYCRIGSIYILQFSLSSTTLSGTVGANLMIQLPFTPTVAGGAPCRLTLAGVQVLGWALTLAGDSKLYVQKFDASNYAIGTNNQTMQGTVIVS